MISAILLIIITIFLPPVGVYLVAGCGADLLINICLTILGYFPGHIHAFYIEYIYYKRRDEARLGVAGQVPAPGVYSDSVNAGGHRGYGTIGSEEAGYAPVAVPPAVRAGSAPVKGAAPPPAYQG